MHIKKAREAAGDEGGEIREDYEEGPPTQASVVTGSVNNNRGFFQDTTCIMRDR